MSTERAVAAVLRDHSYLHVRRCKCGDQIDDFRAHVAAALAPVLAAAVLEAEQRALREAADEFRHTQKKGWRLAHWLDARADRITEPVSHEERPAGYAQALEFADDIADLMSDDRSGKEACECVAYTIRTDYGTGTEHDVDRSNCPIHAGVSDE